MKLLWNWRGIGFLFLQIDYKLHLYGNNVIIIYNNEKIGVNEDEKIKLKLHCERRWGRKDPYKSIQSILGCAL